MTTPPQTDNSINALDLGVRLGRLAAGQEVLQANQERLQATVEAGFREVRGDIKTLLRFMWGALAGVALATLVISLAISCGPWR